MKYLFIDTETTGIEPERHGIIQIGGIVEIDGSKETEFVFNVRPFPQDEIDEISLSISGITREQLEKFETPQQIYQSLKEILRCYGNPYKKPKDYGDRLIPIGHNIRFDLNFLHRFFIKNNDQYLYSLIDPGAAIDTLSLANLLRATGRLKLENARLSTIGEKLGINGEYHNALFDSKAVAEIYHNVRAFIQ